MKTIHVNGDTIASGHSDFYYFVSDELTDTAVRSRAGEPDPYGDVDAIPGAAIACVEFGITEEPQVAAAVSHVTACTLAVASAFIANFTGPDPDRHLFARQWNGDLGFHPGTLRDSYPDFVIGA